MGQLYPYTTNPLGATADGPALADRAGAALADLEITQFHPTALALGDGPLSLVSEAVRGEGGLLRDDDGPAVHARRAPDGRARPARRGRPGDRPARRGDRADVTLDMRHLDPDVVRGRFPTVAALCAAHGLDLATDPDPGHPGRPLRRRRRADRHGRAQHAARPVRDRRVRRDRGPRRQPARVQRPAGGRRAGLGRRAGAARRPRRLAGGPGGPRGQPARDRRPRSRRRGARSRPRCGRASASSATATASPARRPSSRRSPESGDPETDNLLLIGRLAAEAAALRAESRGAHFRRDHPLPVPAWARRIAWVRGRPFSLTPIVAESTRSLAMEAA